MRFRICLLLAAAVGISACFSTTRSWGQSSAQRVASGLSSPLYGTFAPGDTGRMFVVEQGSSGTARIKIMDLNAGTTLATPFLTMSGLQTGGERGLLGMAFDPNFDTNGYFYTYGSYPGGSENHQSVVRRYSVSSNPNVADPNSALDLMTIDQPFSNHNGGWIGFDPTSDDPLLYIATGDGGSGGDPRNNSQDITNNLLGKMLRIDVSRDDFAGSDRNYGIPATNPFVGQTGDDEIWAYGLRNPWRNSFDRETGDLWMGDVGQSALEEVNFQPANSPGGENYGWRVKEGTNCYDNSQTGGNPPCNDSGLTDPVYTYGHNGGIFGGFSLTGGYVYHGSAAEFEGMYFFGDFSTANVWTIDPYAENIQASVIYRNGELPTSASTIRSLASFSEDANGELYIVSLSGDIFRIESTTRDAVWDGNAAVGNAGNGTSWTDANNWTRDGDVDQAMLTKDRVIFSAGSALSNVDLQGNRTVGALVVEGQYSFDGGDLTVSSGNITVTSGATAAFQGNFGAHDSDNSIRKRGAGSLIVNGTTAQVAVLEGKLGGTGTVNFINAYEGGTIAPGDSLVAATSIGQLDASKVEMRPGSSLEIEIGSSTDVDVLSATGTVQVDGTLTVEPDVYAPAARGDVDSFVFLVASAVLGEFDNATYDGESIELDANNTHVGDGLFVGYRQSSTDASIYVYSALPGDANGDGAVDGNDFFIWNNHRFQSGTSWTTGDFDGNGVTDGADLFLWNSNRFTSISLPTRVPEPNASGVLLIGLWMFRRRRAAGQRA